MKLTGHQSPPRSFTDDFFLLIVPIDIELVK